LGNGLRGSEVNGKTGTKRRSSMPDPRPISEKQFVLDSSRKVVSFLQEKGYEENISVKSLQAPAIKVFANILQFCFRQIDPHFTFKGQYDEEIPKLFRSLEYPIAIQKGELKVISQHHWPRLLAALTWLVDLVQFDETRTALNEEMPLDTEDTEGIFFEYLSGSYQIFMEGHDDTSELDARFTAQFEEKNKEIEEECQQFQRTNAVLHKDITKLEEQAARLPTLRKQKYLFQEDVGKFTELVAEFEGYVAKVQRKLTTNEKDLAAKKKRLEALTKERESLQARLDQQEKSGVDYRKMVADKVELELQLTQLRTARDMAQKMCGEHEIALGKLLEVVETEMRDYTELCMRLRLLPGSANTKVPDVSFDLQFKSHARAEEIIVGDLSGTINPALKNLRSSLVVSNKNANEQLFQLGEKLDRMEEQIELKKDDVSNLTNKFQSQETGYRAMKEVLEEDQKQIRNQAKNIRDETEALVKLGLQHIQNAHQASDKLRVEETRIKSQFEAQRMEVTNSFIDVIDRLTNHKQYIQLRLQELMAKAEETAKDVESMDSVFVRSNLNKSQMA
jgi:kinetochore protein NDC80